MTRFAIFSAAAIACLCAYVPVQGQAQSAPAVAHHPTEEQVFDFKMELVRHISGCWLVDPGSYAAKVTVEVGFTVDRDGKLFGNDVRLLASNGDRSTTPTAFQAARRAIIRCMSAGFPLPADEFEQWTDVVITFAPDGMRLR